MKALEGLKGLEGLEGLERSGDSSFSLGIVFVVALVIGITLIYIIVLRKYESGTFSLEKKFRKVGDYIMELSGKTRLAIAISILWPLFVVIIELVETHRHFNWKPVFLLGLIPSLVAWIIWWVIKGFKDGKDQSDSEVPITKSNTKTEFKEPGRSWLISAPMYVIVVIALIGTMFGIFLGPRNPQAGFYLSLWCGAITAIIAKRKNKSGWLWFFIGLIPIGFSVYFILVFLKTIFLQH